MEKIQEGAQVRPDEQADLAKADRLGRDRSKGDDSETRTPAKE